MKDWRTKLYTRVSCHGTVKEEGKCGANPENLVAFFKRAVN
jgi:hypothetical protein